MRVYKQIDRLIIFVSVAFDPRNRFTNRNPVNGFGIRKSIFFERWEIFPRVSFREFDRTREEHLQILQVEFLIIIRNVLFLHRDGRLDSHENEIRYFY